MQRINDLTGKRFGQLKVTGQAGRTPRGAVVWSCECDCGSVVSVVSHSLTTGNTRSCGCLRRTKGAPNRTHNMSRTPLFRIWCAMRNRCENPNVACFKDYGGRGIKVCERWQTFENFLADMGDRPSPKHSIERNDNDKGYEPGNCRWATKGEQAANKRNNRVIEANGEKLVLAEWARRLGCAPTAITARIAAGMSESEAVTKPIPARPNSKLSDEQALEIRELKGKMPASAVSQQFDVSKKTVLNIWNRRTFIDI